MELQLGLALSTNPPSKSSLLHLNNKRTFSQLLHHNSTTNNNNNNNNNEEDLIVLPTLPLLPLTPTTSSNGSTITKSGDNDVEGLVGWPPVNSLRKRLRSHYSDDDDDDEDEEDHEVSGNDQTVWIDPPPPHHHVGAHYRGSSNTLYVKVKMEGVGIARKVDLSVHHSFHTLKDTLMDMFGKCHQHSKCYELAYQDEEGDWLLADDVPWRSFVECAQRLKLVKSSG